MTDLEKVINAIQICYTLGHNCTECQFFSEDDCNDKLMQDVLALLKAQEPVEPAIGGNQKSCWYYICPICQLDIDKGDKYCRHCGRALKWE